MDIAITIVMLVPVLLAVALIIGVIRRNITERQAGDSVDISGAIPSVIVLMVAVLIIVAMGNAASPYVWDEDSGELTIQQDVISGSQGWDSLGADVKSLIINDNVRSVADGAFDTLTGLEYISISDSVEGMTSSAFGVTLKDYLDQTLTEPEAGEYVGTGNGTLYLADDSIFTYRDNNTAIAGLTAAASDAVNIVIPNEYSGTKITSIGYQAFINKTALTRCLTLPGSNLKTTGNGPFTGCTGLTLVSLPEGYQTIGVNTFYGCTGLETISLPSSLVTIYGQAFFDSGIVSIDIPEGVTTMGNSVFNGCTALEAVSLPSTLTSIGSTCFHRCAAITDVTFASGFAAELQSNTFGSWTFYESDGTTQIDKTVAANLAGRTFQGTAAALIEVAAGQLALSPEQIQIVHLHDQELQLMLDSPTIDPLPFQPSVQTQDQEPVSA